MVTNHDDSGLHRHPTTTRGFIETVNWNVKRAKKGTLLPLEDREGESVAKHRVMASFDAVARHR
jgi:hypothetical protein